MSGFAIAMFGVAICVFLCGIGSSLGLFKTSAAAAGVLGENPKKFGKVVVLVLLPATQGLYGFLVGMIAFGKLGADLTVAQGLAMCGACLPVMVAGLITGIFQGKAAANCIYAVGKQDSLGGKMILFPAMIEFYAILGMIISFMLIGTI